MSNEFNIQNIKPARAGCYVCGTRSQVYAIYFHNSKYIARCFEHLTETTNIVTDHPFIDLNKGQAKLVVKQFLLEKDVRSA